MCRMWEVCDIGAAAKWVDASGPRAMNWISITEAHEMQLQESYVKQWMASINDLWHANVGMGYVSLKSKSIEMDIAQRVDASRLVPRHHRKLFSLRVEFRLNLASAFSLCIGHTLSQKGCLCHNIAAVSISEVLEVGVGGLNGPSQRWYM